MRTLLAALIFIVALPDATAQNEFLRGYVISLETHMSKPELYRFFR